MHCFERVDKLHRPSLPTFGRNPNEKAYFTTAVLVESYSRTRSIEIDRYRKYGKKVVAMERV